MRHAATPGSASSLHHAGKPAQAVGWPSRSITRTGQRPSGSFFAELGGGGERESTAPSLAAAKQFPVQGPVSSPAATPRAQVPCTL